MSSFIFIGCRRWRLQDSTRLPDQSCYSARCPAQLKAFAAMNIRRIPTSVAAPFGPYSHAVEVPEGARLLYISGEVGVLPNGTVSETIEAQAEACWRNLLPKSAESAKRSRSLRQRAAT